MLWKSEIISSLQLSHVCRANSRSAISFSFFFFRYKIEISGGLGPTVGKILRVGLMGINAQTRIVDRILSALRDGLQHAVKAKM